MALSKERKEELVAQYGKWLKGSEAIILTDYSGLTVKEMDELRKKVREVGGEYHIIKNTLIKIAFQSAEMPLSEAFFEGPTAVSFVAEDVPGLAKTLSEFAKSSDFLKIKGGYIGKGLIDSDQVKNLADLPPFPVLRAQLLGVLMSPAMQLARLMMEPARQFAQVVKAYSESENMDEAV